MMKVLRWVGYAFGLLVLLLLIAAAVIWIISAHKLNAAPAAMTEHFEQPTPEQLADAERQAHALGCFSCHGDGLRGNKMFDQPGVGTIWAPNLTRVAARMTDEHIARAIRQGVSDKGKPLMIMPSESFQHLSDQEVAALISMIRGLPPGGNDVPANVYGPLGRLGLAMGRFKTAPELVAEYAVQEPIPAGAEVEPGRHVAMLYCSACHAADLTGKEIEPGETSPDLTIAGAYDLDAFRKLLRTGVPASRRKLPMMGPTARSDLSHLNDSEIAALHSYLVARAQKNSH